MMHVKLLIIASSFLLLPFISDAAKIKNAESDIFFSEPTKDDKIVTEHHTSTSTIATSHRNTIEASGDGALDDDEDDEDDESEGSGFDSGVPESHLPNGNNNFFPVDSLDTDDSHTGNGNGHSEEGPDYEDEDENENTNEHDKGDDHSHGSTDEDPLIPKEPSSSSSTQRPPQPPLKPVLEEDDFDTIIDGNHIRTRLKVETYPEDLDFEPRPKQQPVNPIKRPASFFAQPGILAAVIGGTAVGLLCAILLVMFIVYRMRKKDEGSYEVKSKQPLNPYGKPSKDRYRDT